MSDTRDADGRRFVVLSKLDEIGRPMNLLEIGFSATPQAIRNMAARGMVKVTVTMTERGKAFLDKERIRRLRRQVRQDRELRAAKMMGGAA